MRINQIWVYLVCVLAACECYRVLVVFPFPMRSHSLLGYGYVQQLLKAGYEVTYVTPYPTNSTHPNLREIEISSVIATLPTDEITIKSILSSQGPSEIQVLCRLLEVSIHALKHVNFQKILEDPREHFDLVIAEWMSSELYAGLSAVFNCPYIWSSSMEPHWMIIRLMGDTPNPAYSVDYRHIRIAPLNFYERVHELYWQIRIGVTYWLRQKILDEPAYREIYGPLVGKRGRELPEYQHLRLNASMILANTHAALAVPLIVPPNIRMVGGYHINLDDKSLPEDLRRIMDSSKDGVIYFSMGSHLKSAQFPDSIKQGLLRIFGGLKQTVLWKYEEDLPELPKNLHVLKWAPQTSILAHPNCRMFISHGGLLSLLEAIFHGVPVIGIPVFADQGVNVHNAVHKGFALKVALGDNLPDDLQMAINEILTNTSYTQHAKIRSKIYHHRLASPRDELLHHVQEVLLTQGALHLRPAALMTPWYQKLYLDLAAIVFVAIYITKLLLRFLKGAFRNYVVKSSKKKIKMN